MVPTSFTRIRTFFRPRTGRYEHHESEATLNLPRRIDGPAAASQLARDLLRHRREDITLALYMDERHRLIGTAIVAVGWVQVARLSARPILFRAHACQARTVVLVRYGRSRLGSASEAEARSLRTLATACSRYELVIVDHLVVVG